MGIKLKLKLVYRRCWQKKEVLSISEWVKPPPWCKIGTINKLLPMIWEFFCKSCNQELFHLFVSFCNKIYSTSFRFYGLFLGYSFTYQLKIELIGECCHKIKLKWVKNTCFPTFPASLVNSRATLKHLS